MSDFGRAAGDYVRFRKGFPPSFFKHLAALGIRGRILDLGSGTGTIARELGAIGLDISFAMLRESAGLRVAARAEYAPFRNATFDVITAGQCWTWFDGPAVAAESLRLLRPGGCLIVAHFDYLPVSGNAGEATERVLLRYHPTWPMAGVRDHEPKVRADVASGGFRGLSAFSYDEPVEYSHEAWRGRIRACNGVIALRDPARIAAFDADLARELKRFPDPLVIPHRISVLTGRV